MLNKLSGYFRVLRVKHWVKNFFVFLPAFFSGKINLLFSSELVILFISFNLAASSIYILNDIIDLEKDRLHPEKSKRPLASGHISPMEAFVVQGLLVALLITSLFLLKQGWMFVLAYLVLNLAYCFLLKNISIIDVSCISLGFVFRVLAGGSESGVFVSHWMIIMVFLISISMAFAKRRDDLIQDLDKKNIRKSLAGYSIQFLDMAKSISFSITLIAYIMYSISAEVMERIGSDKLYITSFFVFLGIMRYLQIAIVNNKSGSPTDILWKDRFIQVTVICWIISFAIIIYGHTL